MLACMSLSSCWYLLFSLLLGAHTDPLPLAPQLPAALASELQLCNKLRKAAVVYRSPTCL